MGGTAIKGKPDVMLKTKTNKIKSSSNIKASNNSTKSIISSERKFQSTGAVSTFKANINTTEKRSNESLNSPRGSNLVTNSQEFNNRIPRTVKKLKAIVQKTKTQIDAATELDVLKIVKKNNHDFDDYELIENCLAKHFFMRCLEEDARAEIIKEMSLCKIDADTYVFRQDSMGNFFYIIKEGECELFINEDYIKNIRSGESFGELALLHGAPRSGSVKTIGITYVWCLERRNFRKIVDHINYMNFEENKRFINSIPILMNIENDLKSMLASNLIKVYYDKDKVIVKGKI